MSEPYWVALAGGGVDYKGDWASATAYKSGDVVRWNGVEFLAVNPSTGSIPPLAPSAAGQELAYAEITAPVTINATTIGTANVVITAPPVTVDGATPIIVEFYSPSVYPHSVAATQMQVLLFEDGVAIGQLAVLQSPGSGYPLSAQTLPRKLTPSAGSHTYSVRAFTAAGSGSVTAGTGGTNPFPAFIRISTSQPIRMGVAIPPTYGTSLPSSPLDGQEAVLVDSLTNPSYQWRFRYNAGSASAYKWEFVGGADSVALLLPGETTATTVTWLDLATVGPRVVVPRTGDYDLVSGGCQGQHTATGATVWVSGYVGTSVAGAGIGGQVPAAGAPIRLVAVAQRFFAVAAGDDIRLRYHNSTAGTATFHTRHISVRPVRVA